MNASGTSIVLHEYGPNHAGGRAFRYCGGQVEPDDSLVLNSRHAFQGYLIPYWESPFNKQVAVVYACDGKLYLDLSSDPVELLPVRAEIRHRLTGRTIAVHTSAGIKEINVFTPFWRRLSNDGMFPEDVEPIVHLMRALTDASGRTRFLYRFEHGRWPEA